MGHRVFDGRGAQRQPAERLIAAPRAEAICSARSSVPPDLLHSQAGALLLFATLRSRPDAGLRDPAGSRFSAWRPGVQRLGLLTAARPAHHRGSLGGHEPGDGADVGVIGNFFSHERFRRRCSVVQALPLTALNDALRGVMLGAPGSCHFFREALLAYGARSASSSRSRSSGGSSSLNAGRLPPRGQQPVLTFTTGCQLSGPIPDRAPGCYESVLMIPGIAHRLHSGSVGTEVLALAISPRRTMADLRWYAERLRSDYAQSAMAFDGWRARKMSIATVMAEHRRRSARRFRYSPGTCRRLHPRRPVWLIQTWARSGSARRARMESKRTISITVRTRTGDLGTVSC